MHHQVFARLEKALLLLLVASFTVPLAVGAFLRLTHTASPATAWLRNATLNGVQVKPKTVVFKRTKIISAKWQTAFAENFDTNFPGRELLIRVANELCVRVFHMAPVGVLVGPKLSLIEPAYLHEYYLARDDTDALRPIVEDLRRLQEVCDARGTAFAVLITPSKAAIYPENNPEGWQRKYRPGPRYYDKFVALLREKGIHFVDGHRITAEMKPPASSEAPVFPLGGVHWTDPAALGTANGLLDFFASKGLPVEPIKPARTDIVYEHHGSDSDMADLINIVSTLRFPAPVMTLEPSARQVPRRPNTVLIGGSFLWKIFQMLDASRQFSELEYYSYYKLAKYFRADGEQHEVIGGAPPTDFEHDIFAADSLVLELNEERLSEPNHARAFLHDALAALPDPHAARALFHYENPQAYRWEHAISLAANANPADAGRLTGFTPSGGIGAFTVGRVASVRFPRPPGAPEDLLLEVSVVASILTERYPRQFVDVYANGNRVTRWEWSLHSPPLREVVIPKQFLTGDEVALEFRIEHPLSLAELGLGNDIRQMGVCVSSIRLRTAQNVVASSPNLRHGGLPAYEWGESVSFIANNRTASLPALKGWTPPGAAGVYSEGEVASMRFAAPPPGADVELSAMTVGAILGKGQPELVANVFVNGHQVGTWKWRDGSASARKATIPGSVLGTGEVLVEFLFVHPLSPAEMGMGGDPRKLGVCFTNVRFTPLAK